MDTDKFYLGKLCKRNHDYQRLGQTLRHKSNNECIECRRLNKTNKKKLSGNYLGKLCRSNHDYQNTGKSLRRKNTGDCVECHKLRSYGNKRSPHYCPDYFKYRTWLKNPRISLTVPELVHESKIKRYKETRYQWDKEYKEQKKVDYRKRYKSKTQLEKERILDWKNRNPNLVKKQQQRRRERVINQSDGSITDEFINQTKEKTSLCCYCKCKLTPENKTVDHANPIGLGGLHSMTNVVICCAKCNYQKGDMPLKEWLEKPGIHDPFLDRN